MTEEMVSRVKGTILGLVSRGQFPKREPMKYPIGHLSCRTIKMPKNYNHTSTWVPKVWNEFTDFRGEWLWTDGENVYYSGGHTERWQYVLDGDTWKPKTWTFTDGHTNLDGDNVWTDGKNIYYSYYGEQYVLNGDTWEPKVWGGLTNFWGRYIWTDGTNIYYSETNFDIVDRQYVLDGDTWKPKVWNGIPVADGMQVLEGRYVWSDGTNIYSYASFYVKSGVFVLNGDTWERMVWNEIEAVSGDPLSPNEPHLTWTDGRNIYYSWYSNDYYYAHAVLSRSTWKNKEWGGTHAFFSNDSSYEDIWSDGVHIYFSQYVDGAYEHYVLI